MSPLYMLDTDVVSYAIKGRSPGVRARLREIPPSSVCVSAITHAELMYGLKRLPSQHTLHGVVHAFLQLVPVRAWVEQAADFYAEIRHQLTSAGQLIGELDIMIAAHALAMDAVLVTNNARHFERIRLPLRLENWSSAGE